VGRLSCLLTAKIPKQALKEYERAVRAIKDHNTQGTIARLENAIKLGPDFYNAHLGLAQEYRKTGRRWMPPNRNLLVHSN